MDDDLRDLTKLTPTTARVATTSQSLIGAVLEQATEDELMEEAREMADAEVRDGMGNRAQRRARGRRSPMMAQFRQWPRYSFEKHLRKAEAAALAEGMSESDVSYHVGVLRNRLAKSFPDHPKCEERGHDLRVAPNGKVVCVRSQD